MAENDSIPSNALGSAAGRVDLAVEPYVKYAIEIEDEGVGISEENQKNLFIDFGKLAEHDKINP